MASYSVLGDMLSTLERIGIADIILPFLLVFTLVFATLQKTKILGENKRFSSIVALVLGLSVVIPHALNAYPPGGDVVEIINAALPQIALVLIAALMIMIVIGVWGVAPAWKGPLTGIIMIASAGIILWIFAGATEFVDIPAFLDDPETQALLVVLAVFGLIVMVITGEEKQGGGFLEGLKNLGEFFEKK